MRAAAVALSLVVAASCSSIGGDEAASGDPSVVPADSGRIDVGGYELAYQCEGDRSESPTVILEAGYDSGGTSTWFELQPKIAQLARVCTYDRAGVGTSDARPASMEPVKGTQIAAELDALMTGMEAAGPYLLVGHSYGGLLVRTYGANYQDEVAGMVLIDASSEPEIEIYRRLHADAWVDGGMRVDIDDVADDVRKVRLGAKPLIVLTAEIIEDEWLSQVPDEAAAAQARLATLSTNVVHVLARDTGHFIQDERPSLVLEAIRQVVEAARSGEDLEACGAAFEQASGECVAEGTVPELLAP